MALRYHIRMATKAATSPEYDRFNALVTQVLSVPKSEIQKRIAEEKRASDANPNKRGPKRKLKQTT
jgi:hypothetical protein